MEVSERDIFFHTPEELDAFLDAKEFEKDPFYYKECFITPRALITLLNHSIRGGRNEILGFLYGYAYDRRFILTDAFATSVLGTETNVNSTEQANQEMILHLTGNQECGRAEPISGWYHSHPSYGCWLSGVDIETQRTCQEGYKTFVALVVDPIQTASTGKVYLEAFRVLPQAQCVDNKSIDNSSIPPDKLEDFGARANEYYQLEMHQFISDADKSILKDIVSRSWSEYLIESPLRSGSDFLNKLVNQAFTRLGSLGPNPSATDLENLSTLARRISSDKKSAIKISRMKRSVFRP